MSNVIVGTFLQFNRKPQTKNIQAVPDFFKNFSQIQLHLGLTILFLAKTFCKYLYPDSCTKPNNLIDLFSFKYIVLLVDKLCLKPKRLKVLHFFYKTFFKF